MPNPLTSPRRAVAAVLTALALAATGCAGSNAGVLDLPADEVLATAVQRSTEHTSARMRVRTVTTSPQGEVTVVGEGVGDGRAGHFTATMEGVDPDGPVEVEMLLVDGVAYQRSEIFSQALGTTATWISFDMEAVVPGFEAITDQARQLDPTRSLEQLREVGRVSEIGPETVNGVSTKHYTAVVTMRASFEAAGVDEATMQQYVDLTGIDLDADVPMEVWIDDEGLVRRTRVQIATDAFSTDTTTDILDYGVAVDVTAPPADQTVSIEDLQG